MLDIYAQTFMTATRHRRSDRPCVKVRTTTRRGWFGRQTKCIDLDRL